MICRPIPENSCLEIVGPGRARPRGMPLVVLGDYQPDDPYHRAVQAAAGDEVRLPRAPCTTRSSWARCGGTRGSTSTVTPSAAPTPRSSRRWRQATPSSPAQRLQHVGGRGGRAVLHRRGRARRPAGRGARPRRGASTWAKGRERFEAEFTWEHIGSQYEQALLPGDGPARTTTRGQDAGDDRIASWGWARWGCRTCRLVRPLPDVEVVGVCDSTGYVLDVLGKYTGLPTFTDYAEMLRAARPDAVIVATPTHLHEPMVRAALEGGIHVFCEKPLVLDPVEGAALVRLAEEKGLVTQVGYHNRHVGSFREAKRLLDLGAIGTVRGALAEAYGPVVVRRPDAPGAHAAGSGGGSLYDYAAHPLDLLTWYLGDPVSVDGAHLTSIHSTETDDAVAATICLRRRDRRAQRQLVRRLPAQDVDPDQPVGRRRPDRRRPLRGAGVPQRLGSRPRGLRGGLERALRHRPAARAGLLRARRGVLRAARGLRPPGRRARRRGVSTFASALATDRVIAAIRARMPTAAPVAGTAPDSRQPLRPRPIGRNRRRRPRAGPWLGSVRAWHRGRAARRAAAHRRSA